MNIFTASHETSGVGWIISAVAVRTSDTASTSKPTRCCVSCASKRASARWVQPRSAQTFGSPSDGSGVRDAADPHEPWKPRAE